MRQAQRYTNWARGLDENNMWVTWPLRTRVVRGGILALEVLIAGLGTTWLLADHPRHSNLSFWAGAAITIFIASFFVALIAHPEGAVALYLRLLGVLLVGLVIAGFVFTIILLANVGN